MFREEDFINYFLNGRFIGDVDVLRLKQLFSSSKENRVETLLKTDFIDDNVVAKALSIYTSARLITKISELKLSPKLYEIDMQLAKDLNVFPLEDSVTGEECLLCTNPVDTRVKELIVKWYNERVIVCVCTNSIMESFYNLNASIVSERIAGTISVKTRDEIKILVRKIILSAAKQKASDIHIYGTDSGGEVSFRIDGDLRVQETLTKNIFDRLSTFITSSDNSVINGNNAKKPRTGIMRLGIDGKTYELRLNLEPSVTGIDVNMRFLYAEHFNFDELGISEKHKSVIQKLISRKSGMIVLSGRVGSGKSTTLYSMIEQLKTDRAICTVEDPVEHKVSGITQINANEDVSYTDAVASFLRHDPDIIMVGEFRTQQVAKACVRAAENGHLLLTTTHCRNAVGVISRLRGLGISNTEIVDNLVAVIHQNLVKRVCQKCSVEGSATLQEIGKMINEPEIGYDSIPVRVSVGCPECNKGNVGRCLITEILIINQDMREMIETNKTVYEIEKYCWEHRNEVYFSAEEEVCEHMINGVISWDTAVKTINQLKG